jgi:HEAT repeat protein
VPNPELDEEHEERIATLIRNAREAGSWRERRYAVRALAEHAAARVAGQGRDQLAQQVFDALTAALTDTSAEVGAAAVEALDAWAPLDDVRATQALLSVLDNGSGYHASLVRALSARALGRRLSMDRSEPLLDAVGDPDAEVSVAAIMALAEGGFDGAADRLLGVLEEPTGYYLPLTRLTAARGLSILGAAGGAEAQRLEQVRGREQDASVLQALPSPSARPSV